jgi:hypothetical protein
MNTNWKIVQLDCYPEYEGKTDVVVVVHWTVSATDGTDPATSNSTSAYGSQAVQLDPNAPFVPVNELDEETVVGWVQGAMGERYTELMTGLEKELERLANPPMVSPPLPWRRF